MLNRIELYPKADLSGAPIVYTDSDGVKFIILSTRPFDICSEDDHYAPPQWLESFMREANKCDYEILIYPHLEEHYGFSLLIDTDSETLSPVVVEYNEERGSYDLY